LRRCVSLQPITRAAGCSPSLSSAPSTRPLANRVEQCPQQVFALIASLTGNTTWLDAASLFDRRCFTAPMALAGALHESQSQDGQPEAALQPQPTLEQRAWAQGEEEAAVAGATMRGMHANAQIAYILGAAAKFEVAGDVRDRLAAESFWRTMQTK
jgi:DUF1680 family protein